MQWATAVGLEKPNRHTEKRQTENRQRTENRQTEKAITEATLIPWIAGLSGPIMLSNTVSYYCK